VTAGIQTTLITRNYVPLLKIAARFLIDIKPPTCQSASASAAAVAIQFNSISLIQATWPIQEHERQMNRQKAADRKNSTTQKTY